MPSYEYRDGKLTEVPDVIVEEDRTGTEPITRTVVIRNGATLVTRESISGTVEVEQGALDAHGHVSGTVSVGRGCVATFHSKMTGTLSVSPGGRAVIAAGATALGAMSINGELVNEGTRGVQISGRGRVEDREGSQIRQPDETTADGTVIYRS